MQAVERIAEVLTMIVCPACHSSLALDGARLRCDGCGAMYPVVDGIPALIAERAEAGQQPSETLSES